MSADHRVPRPPLDAIDAVDGVLAGARDLHARLERWAAEAISTEAADQRGRERWLRQQAEEQASLTGILVDLAEQRLPVTVHTVAGRRHQAVIAAVGCDFSALQTEQGRPLLIAHRAISTIRPRPTAHRLPIGDREVDVDLQLVDAIAWLAAERPRVSIVTVANELVTGILRGIGIDLVTLVPEPEDGPRSRVYVPTGAIAEVIRH